MTAEQSERMNLLRSALKGLDASISVSGDDGFVVSVRIKVPIDMVRDLPVEVRHTVKWIMDNEFDRG